ncbi:FRG domain-containing protein [Streptococcus ruminicola]|uniref:FRG domain-containing protein n=1 Tax=Streptococcus ruminicola TaxID=2686210 RepID=UPI0024144E64|nr:FRG domain-containing protein [Streptococcus ruminicola]WFM80984.1 FRG domain-containing protein [Streptococcus ruminicola]
MHSSDYLNNAIEVTSVDEYIKEINLIYQNEESIGKRFYFRGQAADYWDIRPSIFRNNLISVEHNLMAEPRRKLPKEFRSLGDTFEIMEKYQHYGLSTRLLDVTSNPLVALYFACEPNDSEEKYGLDDSETETRCPNGVVYYKQTDSVYRYDDSIIKIIACIAEYNLSEININKLLDDLGKKVFLTRDYSEDDNIIQLINRLQESYVVLPAVNNERLSRQSGAFLLPAKFNFKNAESDIRKTVIEKSVCNLRDEFESLVFYVTSDNKKQIREELNQFDINEASLFPELEYQLKHIQTEFAKETKSVNQFEKYIEQNGYAGNSCFEDVKIDISKIEEIVCDYHFENNVEDKIINVFKENTVTDWFKRNSILSKIKISISKILIKNNYSKGTAENYASEILDKVLN